MTKEIHLILHNIRSAYNVGSIFRTADAAGVSKIYLTGYTPSPETDKVRKTSLGAEKTIPWKKTGQIAPLIKSLIKDGTEIIALEQSDKSIDYRNFKPKFPLALIVGNEVNGLSKAVLKNVNQTIDIPMYGKKESLNVAVATGIAVYKIIEKTK
jgi:23S rRNA (guanosine2251-2'-O)-methyltransferase